MWPAVAAVVVVAILAPPALPAHSSHLPAATPAPPAPAGRLEGRVLRGGEGAPGVRVMLCEVVKLPDPGTRSPDVVRWEGCRTRAEATTDAQGVYRFEEQPPGDYVVMVESGSTWTFMERSRTNSGSVVRIDREIIRILRHTVAPGKTTSAEPVTVMAEVEILEPTRGAVVRMPRPTLRWTPVEGAAHYEVSMASTQSLPHGELRRFLVGKKLFDRRRSRAPELTLAQGLTNCEYVWWVEAFDAGGVKVAESWNYWSNANLSAGAGYFRVSDQPTSCR